MKKLIAVLAFSVLCASSYGLDAGLNFRISSMSTNDVGTTNFITQATDGYLKAVAVHNPSNVSVTIVLKTSADTTLGVERNLLSVTNTESTIYYPVISDETYLGVGVTSYGSEILCRDTFSLVTGVSTSPGCPLRVTLVTDRAD